MKLYVLVRNDLSKSQQAVQAGHAVAEYLLRGPLSCWNNGTLVYLKVRNETELIKWGDKLTSNNIEWVGFKEPDIGDQLTAIATVSHGSQFQNLKLL